MARRRRFSSTFFLYAQAYSSWVREIIQHTIHLSSIILHTPKDHSIVIVVKKTKPENSKKVKQIQQRHVISTII
uniref:Putative secreted peptide n=1 Tax=Anopheles braziliensis TaxID=58242 RepID=A0A2M3ZWP4_9DIPT